MGAEDVEYERFVRSIEQAILRAEGLRNINVQHDVQLKGISRTRQIDVYWEYRLGGVLHRVIINCKRYRSKVEVRDVEQMLGILHDMPGVRGVIVTTVGYQQGAIDCAMAHNIGLKIIRPPEDADWEGRIRSVNLGYRINRAQLLGCDVGLNEDWARANLGSEAESLSGNLTAHTGLARVRDLKTGEVRTLNDLFNQLLRENPTEPGCEGQAVIEWENAMFEAPGQPSARVDGIAFRWRVLEGERQRVELRNHADAIVRDAIAGTLQFVDLEGFVSEDVERR